MVAWSGHCLMAAPTNEFPSSSRADHCKLLAVDEQELDTSSLHAHIVGPYAKQRLLASQQLQPPYGVSLDDAAVSLLEDLSHLAPSVAKELVPKTATWDAATFRLINDVYFEGEEKSYIAMSYVWNKVSRDTPKKLISPVGDLPFGWVQTVEQFPLPTTRGMFLGVLNERRAEEGLWFDQVCINQEDETEKASAMGAMDTIYRNARVVVVALDDIAATTQEIMFLEQYIHHYAFSDLPLDQQPNRGLHPPIMHQHHLFRSFAERVLSSMWFERAWCTLEMRMGRSHVFLVPYMAEHGDEDAYTIIRFTGAFLVHMLILASEVVTAPSTQQLIRSLLQHFRNPSFNDELAVHSPNHPIPQPISYSFIPTITEIFGMKAGGNPRLPEYLRRLDANRDKASIALNLSNIPLAMRPASPLQRPTIEDECIRQLLLIGLAARDPLTLCTTGAPLHLHDGSISWLCKPTPLDLPPSYTSPPPAFPATKTPTTQGSDGRAEYVQLDLVFLELPHRTQPNPSFHAQVQRAREFVDVCITYQVQSHTLWNLWQAPNHPRAPTMRNIFIQTLACVFDCGPSWLLDVVSQPLFPAGLPHFDAQAMEMLFSSPAAACVQNYAAMPLLSGLIGAVATLIAHGIPWASTASERTHGPLIISNSPASTPPASQASYGLTHPHYTSPPAFGKALIFAPFAHSKTLLVAVPNAVKGVEYSGLARGWILTTSHPYTGVPQGTVSWVLRGKGVVFGEGGFNGGVGGEGVVRNHRVYGADVS